MNLDENNQIRETRSNNIPQAELEARGLPEYCYTELQPDKAIVLLKRGAMGYFPTETVFEDGVVDPEFVVSAALLNEALGVTQAQHDAMLFGSMFGFHCAGADPDIQTELKEQG